MSSEKMHKKGYDCITYTVPDYMRNAQTFSPPPLPTVRSLMKGEKKL